jgi:hypothetical protein
MTTILKEFCKHVVYEQPQPVKQKLLTIATPFYYSFHFLEQYLTALQKLDYPKELLTLIFAVQGADDTYDVLKDFQKRMQHRYKQIILEQRGEIFAGETTRKRNNLNICDQRNWLKSQTTDDVLFIGHDNFPPPNTIIRLLEGQSLGGDIVGGVYSFIKYGSLGFTSFFMLEDKANDKRWPTTSLVKHDDKLWFPKCLYGERVWTWTTGMDCTLIKRDVLDNIDFSVGLTDYITDDVEFCHRAKCKSYRVLSDYGLWVPHWGFTLQFIPDSIWQGYIQVLCTVKPQLIPRRKMLDAIRNPQLKSLSLPVSA